MVEVDEAGFVIAVVAVEIAELPVMLAEPVAVIVVEFVEVVAVVVENFVQHCFQSQYCLKKGKKIETK